jgi:hypothetical protein
MILLLFAAAATLPPLPPIKGTGSLGSGAGVTTFTFFVAGDNRPDSGNDPSTGFVQLISAMSAASPKPAFVLWGGDIVKGKKSSDAKKQYPAVLKLFQQLGVPVFNVPGNHELDKKGSGDCHDAVDDDGKLLTDYTTDVSAQPYGWFQYGNSIFIGINTEETPGENHQPSGCFNGYVSPTQLSLVQAKIASVPKGTNVFLFMHRPTQDNNHHAIAPDKQDQNTNYGKALEAFVKYVNSLANPNVVYVFASHDHRCFQAVPGSATTTGFIITGGAGAPLSSDPGGFYHYLKVTVTGSSASVTVVPLSGSPSCGSP